MACPDKIRDQAIIAEVNRRKIVQPVMITIDGSLSDYLNTGVDENNIIKTERVGTEWLITLKEQLR